MIKMAAREGSSLEVDGFERHEPPRMVQRELGDMTNDGIIWG